MVVAELVWLWLESSAVERVAHADAAAAVVADSAVVVVVVGCDAVDDANVDDGDVAEAE